MKCDICKKKEATVHVTEIINDEMTELHLCEDCAKKKSFQMDKHFGLSDMLAGLSDFETPLQEEGETKKEKLKCSNCGLTYEDFRKIGRLGCSECYSTFKDQLTPLLKRIHKATQHSGSVPLKKPHSKEKKEKASREKSEEESKIDRLKKEMQKAVEKEAFEKAAEIRDEIKELKEEESEKEE